MLSCSCAGLRSTPTLPQALPSDWDGRRQVLQEWSRFDMRGRVAVASGEEGFTAALRWMQRDERARVEFDGPLGVGGLRLQLERGRLVDEGVRKELERRLGFALPVESLRYWMLGVPDPAQSADETLAATSLRLEGLQQAGWSLRFSDYAPIADANYELPRRIEATREAVRVRLLIEGWGSKR